MVLSEVMPRMRFAFSLEASRAVPERPSTRVGSHLSSLGSRLRSAAAFTVRGRQVRDPERQKGGTEEDGLHQCCHVDHSIEQKE